jgi:hypothetical protein
MQQYSLSVHLFNEYGGRAILDNEEITYPQRQFNIGMKVGVRQFFLMPGFLDIEDVQDKTHRKFLKDLLEAETAITENIIISRYSSEEEILNEIIQSSGELTSYSQQIEKNPVFLIIMHQKDTSAGIELVAFLNKKNISISIYQGHNNQIDVSELENQIKAADAIIVVFGLAIKAWLIRNIEYIIKVVSLQYSSLKTIGIYLTPDRKESIDLPFSAFLNINILDNSHGFKPETLNPLLEIFDIKD